MSDGMSQSESRWQYKYIQKYGEVSFKALLKGNVDIAAKTGIPMILPLIGVIGAVGMTLSQMLESGFTNVQYLHLTPKLVVNSLVPGLIYFIGQRRATVTGEEGTEFGALMKAQQWLVAAITFIGVLLVITLNSALVLTTFYLLTQSGGVPTGFTPVAAGVSVLCIGVVAPVVVWKKIG